MKNLWALLAAVMTAGALYASEPVIDAPENPAVKVVYIDGKPYNATPAAVAAPAPSVVQPPAVMTAAAPPAVPGPNVQSASEALEIAKAQERMALYIGAFGMVAALVLRFLNERKKLDADRWVGLTQHVYNAVQASGVLGAKPKLEKGLEIFERQFMKTYGKVPTEKDKTDFENDVALLAYDDDTPQKRAA